VRRILSFSLGLGIGLVVGGNLVRRLDAAQQRFAPDRLGVAAAVMVDNVRGLLVGLATGGRGRGDDPFDARGGQVVEHPTARRADKGGPWTR
jgi:hypothetical protein